LSERGGCQVREFEAAGALGFLFVKPAIGEPTLSDLCTIETTRHKSTVLKFTELKRFVSKLYVLELTMLEDKR